MRTALQRHFWRLKTQHQKAVEEPKCPGCGETRLIDLDVPRRRYVCDVCSRQWPKK